jgi:hypothetical protein
MEFALGDKQGNRYRTRGELALLIRVSAQGEAGTGVEKRVWSPLPYKGV